jgi:hypothetical protein
MKAVSGGGGGGRQLVADVSVDGSGQRAGGLLLLAAARQLLAYNGQWPAEECWWEAELLLTKLWERCDSLT